MPREKRYTEAEWRAIDDLRKNWGAFCDADPFDGAADFSERMLAAGAGTAAEPVAWRDAINALIVCAEQVTDDDGWVHSHAVSAIRKGRAALDTTPPEPAAAALIRERELRDAALADVMTFKAEAAALREALAAESENQKTIIRHADKDKALSSMGRARIIYECRAVIRAIGSIVDRAALAQHKGVSDA